MSDARSTVFVVDDDVSVRESLELLIHCAGWRPETFASARDFLSHARAGAPSCLLLDVGLPDLNGLDLQKLLADRTDMPVVFITGCGDVPTTVQAMKRGAVDFLTKPLEQAALMRAINAALAQDRDTRRKKAELADLQKRLSSLTPREREVLPLVASGLLNKQAAAELGVSEVTLQIHRCSIMKKMEAGSLAELVRMAGALAIPMTRSRHSQR
jgi:FixJ family two-component response regulator